MKLNRKSLLNILGVDENKLKERIRIDLSNKNITQIDEETFRDLKKMVSINLSGNKISELGERSLEGLKNLKTINFSGNKISLIHEEAFKSLKNLERIDLSGNILDWNIDKQLFFGLEKLTHIYLHNNESLKQNGKLSMHIPDNVQYVTFRFQTKNDLDIVRNVYKMDRKTPGLALIIINFEFDNETQNLPYKKDIKSLIDCFKSLGFEILLNYNKTVEEMKKLLEENATKNHSKYSCFVCVMSSHGGKDGFVGVKSDSFYPEEYILKTFSGKLIGKPKLFFIDACRGKRFINDTSFLGFGLPQQSLSLMDVSDTLIYYSTINDFVSLIDDGSLFIQSFTKIFARDSGIHSLNDMLTTINDHVSKQIINGKKQMPTPILNTLRKDFYF